MRTLMITLLLSLGLHAASLDWSRSYEKGLESAKVTNKPLLLYLCMPGCGTCRFMNEEVFTDRDVKAYLQKHFVYVKLYGDDKSLPEDLKMPMAPVFHFIDPRSNERIDTIVGGKRVDAFLDTLESILETYNNPESE